MNLGAVSPRTLAHALAALEGATADTRVLAGGTDLMVELENGRTRPDRVVDVWGVDELRGIREEDGGVRLGSLTTCTEMLHSDLVTDILRDATDEVGAEQIKNRATIGGNLGTASPAADLNPVLLALDAKVRLISTGGTREFSAAEFLTGYRETLRRPEELIESVWIPPRPVNERRAFRKVGTRRAQSISKVVLALALTFDGDRIASVRAGAGSVAPRTIGLSSLNALVGHVPDTERIDEAARSAARNDCVPIDDVRSTASYRRAVVYRVLRTVLGELCRQR